MCMSFRPNRFKPPIRRNIAFPLSHPYSYLNCILTIFSLYRLLSKCQSINEYLLSTGLSQAPFCARCQGVSADQVCKYVWMQSLICRNDNVGKALIIQSSYFIKEAIESQEGQLRMDLNLVTLVAQGHPLSHWQSSESKMFDMRLPTYC